MPEAAWLRLVADLDWPSNCALSSSSGAAQAETSAARGTLEKHLKERTSELKAAEASILQELREANERRERQANVLATALAHLAPLRGNNRHVGMQQVFDELETLRPRALEEEARSDALSRQEQIAALKDSLGAQESAMRERIADGRLN